MILANNLDNLVNNYIEAVAVLLFGIGFCLLLFNRNLIKKIMGLNIMDTGVYLFLASMGYIDGKLSPIENPAASGVDSYVNPIPSGLVLTGIVVSVSVTAIMLALTIRLYKRYHTLNLDEVYEIVYKEHDESEDDE